MDSFAITEGLAAQEQQKNQSEPINSKLSEETNKFQRAIAAWRGIDLASTIAKLDTTASDLVEHQRDALVQRKELAQKTKDFKKLEDNSKLSEYKGLLKAYQSFIDLLTNQGKTSSSSFLQLYSSLSEAPDPYPLLEASVDSLVLSEDTVPKLTSERNQLQQSVDRLTRQQEETEKRLQEERAARKKLEENQESRAKEIEASWEGVLAEKTNNWAAKEKSLEEKVENQERLIKELKASYEVSQRMGEDDDNEGARSGATAAELELVSADLEKTGLRLADVEARNEQLRLELAQAVSHSNPDQPTSVEDDPAYLRLQSENSSLLRKLDAARYDKDSTRHSWEAKLLQAERNATKSSTERDELRSRLEKVADYDDIRRELEMLKSIELMAGDDEEVGETAGEGDASGTNGATAKTSKEKNSLEQLLLARNKKLTDELTVLRVSSRDLQTQLDTLRGELFTTKKDLEKSRGLSTTLENDLLRVQEEAANTFPSSGMSVAGTYSSKYPHSARRGASSPTSSIISGFDQSAASANTMDAIRAGEAVGGGSGLLPMIQAQRDRFKKKNTELEEDLSKMYATVKSLRQEVASLQKDNLGLYEKTRYVSTYSRGGQGGSTSASSYAKAPGSTVYASSETPSGLSLDRYQSAYEARLSPFAAFKGRESARAYNRMSLPERIVFSLTRIIMANRTSRNLFAGYCFALHILLFVMLYMMSSMEIEKHSTMSTLGGAAAAAYGGNGGGSGSGSGSGTGSGSGQLHGDDWQQEGFNHAS